MKKLSFKYVFALVLLLMIVIPNKVLAKTNSRDYTIESYDIDMFVNEDNTFDITERITTYFNISKHRNNKKDTIKKYYNKNRWNHIK